MRGRRARCRCVPADSRACPWSYSVSTSLAFIVSPPSAAAPVGAYAARLAKDIFAHAAKSPSPAGLATVNIYVDQPSAALQLGVDEVRWGGG